MALKFFEHFLYIAEALNNIGGMGVPLWDDQDEFFYDVLHFPDGGFERLKVRSLVGLMPLLAVETIEPDLLQRLPDFRRRGDEFLLECPTGSGNKATLWQVAAELSRRLESILLRAADGRRPVFGQVELFQTDPHWRDYAPFHEYFHGDSGRGVGASHQTGWTGVVAKLLEQTATQMAAPRQESARDVAALEGVAR